MNRPTHQPEDIAKRRKSARKLAYWLVGAAIAVYALFMVLVWSNHHG